MYAYTDGYYLYISLPNIPHGRQQIPRYGVWILNRFIGMFIAGSCIQLPIPMLDQLTDIILSSEQSFVEPVIHVRILKRGIRSHDIPGKSYQAGDILVACDNSNGSAGYMGHAAIIVNAKSLVEAVPKYPQVRIDTLEQFFKAHPLHAHFRPRNKEMGLKAATFAIRYVEQYNENQKNGVSNPQFSLSPHVQIDELSQYIYCSKLVWLCYFYGANYKFYNDFLWFAPEDLDECLENDPNFELVYKHPDFHFKINV